ncbi:hypothetical protein N0V88_004945 [Collariella sp. IMI 366227]|nr:hypothetical protein N0V88_004945 [Collariella sp. IMI 366227]
MYGSLDYEAGATQKRDRNAEWQLTWLIQAEREASKIVQKDRTKRVREARDEAKKEIEAYKAKKEAEFKKFESEHTQGNKSAEEEANREADAKIQEIRTAGKKNQDKVINDLLSAVFDVHPAPVS